MIEKIILMIWLSVALLMTTTAIIQNRNGFRPQVSTQDVVTFIIWPFIIPLFTLTDYIFSRKKDYGRD